MPGQYQITLRSGPNPGTVFTLAPFLPSLLPSFPTTYFLVQLSSPLPSSTVSPSPRCVTPTPFFTPHSILSPAHHAVYTFNSLTVSLVPPLTHTHSPTYSSHC